MLQTPEFVEEFILDRTLDPAVATFGLADTDLIDPTCGSGHFLLGAFDRLFTRWADAEPGTNRRELARRALDAIAGVDINPFAVAIARFRLLVAALRAGGDQRLTDAPIYPIRIAVGDSLLHTQTQLTLAGVGRDDDVAAAAAHGYSTEDAEAARALLSRQWAVVVGNPPYIIVKDPALNQLYRKRYTTCRGKYSLGVPFTERFWQLARRSTKELERAGYVGMITANSFMKREMGKDLIEKWFPIHDLTHLLDTSGAYIPGHGTPTVILLGRSRRPVAPSVRAVLGIRGEPGTPADPSKGLVWTDIVGHLEHPGDQTDFVSVTDLDRGRLASHPWSIGGGGAADLKDRLDRAGMTILGDRTDSTGFGAITGDDDAFLGFDAAAVARVAVPSRRLVHGEAVRDWGLNGDAKAIWPFGADLGRTTDSHLLRVLWPLRTGLRSGLMFKKTKADRGIEWWEYAFVSAGRLTAPALITFAFVATHNHFVLDRGGKVFNRSAPVIKLPAGATEAAHLELLGLLNSSTACFWMKQVFHNKGSTVDVKGARQTTDPFENFFEFDGTKLQSFPLPSELPRVLGAVLDRLAADLAASTPTALAAGGLPTMARLDSLRQSYDRLRGRMIGLQEQLDWDTYRLYGLLDDDLTLPGGEPLLALGERAFEIALARKAAAGEESTTWFTRHGSRPITDLPAHWSPDYRALVERRIELIESNPEIGLIERPEYKRRWNTTSWRQQQAEALRGWLLDRLETPAYWPSEQLTSTARLAERARVDEDFMTVARLSTGRDDVDVAALVADLVKNEAVPYLAALRYKDSGLRKWAQWCDTWALQRREDAGDDVGDIPVPPKYTSADFLGVAWGHRGKLDVPKERFVSYPGAQRESDASLVVGWAGWDHLQRARALATAYLQAKRDGRATEDLLPLLAGLAELVPWLLQWYDDPNADPALDRPGSQIRALIDNELRTLQLTPNDLTAWRPEPPRRGRAAARR